MQLLERVLVTQFLFLVFFQWEEFWIQLLEPKYWLIKKLLPWWVNHSTVQSTFFVQKFEYGFSNILKSRIFCDGFHIVSGQRQTTKWNDAAIISCICLAVLFSELKLKWSNLAKTILKLPKSYDLHFHILTSNDNF